MPDFLTELGELAQSGKANIIKLPNISASVPQLKECIKELQSQGYAVPAYPEDPKDDKEKEVKARYGKVLGSAVNPVLREGNSDRRAAGPVKAYAQKNPHKLKDFPSESKTHVAHMQEGDYYGSEQSAVLPEADTLRIEFETDEGKTEVLKEGIKMQKGEVIDASMMSVAAS